MTTQAKHTPGPWEIGSINKRDKNLWWAAVFTPKNTGKPHTPRACEALGIDREECEANARLIASAPELLEALETIATGNTDPARMVEIAREAIAKTEGAQ